MADSKRGNRGLAVIGVGVVALVAIVALVFALRAASDRSSQIDRLDNDLALATEELDAANATSDDLAAQVALVESDAALMASRWLAEVAVGRQYSPKESRLLAVEAANRQAGPDAIGALGAVLFSDPRVEAPISELAHDGPVWVTAVAADGGLVATGSHDSTVKLWSGDGEPVATLRHSGEVLAAAFSGDGQLVASGSRDGAATVWTVAGDEMTVATHDDQVNDVALSSDGSWLVSGGHDGMALVTEVTTGVVQHELGHPDVVWAVAISTDDRHVATGSKDGQVRVWDLDSGDLVSEYAVGTSVETLSYSPDGAWLFAGGQQGMALVIPTSDGEASPLDNDGFRGGIVDVDWHPDGSEVVIVSLGGIHRYGLPDLMLVADHRVAGGARGVAYGPDGSWLASASGDFQFSFGQIIFWDAVSGKELAALNLGGPVETIRMTADGSALAGFRMTEDLVEVGGAWLVPGPDAWVRLACEDTDATISAQTWAELTGVDEARQTDCS